MLRSITCLAAILFGTSACLADGIAWEVRPDFKNDEAAMEISGAACAGASNEQQWCFAVNDEKKYVQVFSVDGQTLVPGDRLRVLEKQDCQGNDFSEPDIEGAAYHGGFVYVTGSHGLSRRGEEFSPSRFFVYRMPVDAESGKPAFEVTRDAVADKIRRSDKLRAIIKSADGLAEFAERPLSDNGANIEGIGALGDSLYFGFRAPSGPKGAIVLQVAIDRLFATSDTPAKVHVLDLGLGYGIREMARIGDAFLVLTGAAGEDDLLPAVWHWTPGTNPRLLRVFRVPEEHKAEGLLVLDAEDQKKVRILLLFDGQQNGRPTEFTIQVQ